MNAPLLDVDNLTVRFDTDRGHFDAVRAVSWRLERGRCFGLVGESGCGKSMMALALMGLLPQNGRVHAGRVLLEGLCLTDLSPRAMNAVRGQRMSMIFQEPMISLNPVLRVGAQVAEVLTLHKGLSGAAAQRRVVELFDAVGIADPARRVGDFPHQLAGGMRQRVMIAMALACSPEVLVADEPTTALDVTIQGQILALLKRLAREEGMGLVLITHDLGVVASMADAVGVMYAGALVECAPVDALFHAPLHPYTQGLMRSSPSLESLGAKRLPTIAGSVPPLDALPSGCAFRPRCPHAIEACANAPPVVTLGDHMVLCYLHSKT